MQCSGVETCFFDSMHFIVINPQNIQCFVDFFCSYELWYNQKKCNYENNRQRSS